MVAAGAKTRAPSKIDGYTQTPSEDKCQCHDGQNSKAQNCKSERIVRGNLEHRGLSHLGNVHTHSLIYRMAGNRPLTAVVAPAFTSGAVPRSRSPMREKEPTAATTPANKRPTTKIFT